jgi:hypothetical protein
MKKKATIALLGALACWAQQNTAGQITGIVKGDDGSAVSGAAVYLKRTQTSGQSPRQQSEWATTAAADGTFEVGPLPNGQYTLCAQITLGNWLNPCEWGNSPPAVTVAPPQRSASATIVMKRGAVVSIRVNDPGQLLAQNEGKVPGAHLLLGVRNDAFGFRSASVASQDSGGRNYQVTIPFGESVNLVIASPFFSLANATGQALPTTGANTMQLLTPSGQTPPAITFGVTGGGK